MSSNYAVALVALVGTALATPGTCQSSNYEWRPSPFYVQGDWEQAELLPLPAQGFWDLSTSNGANAVLGPTSTGDVGFVQLLQGSAQIVSTSSCLGAKRLAIAPYSSITLIPASAPTATTTSKKSPWTVGGVGVVQCVVSLGADLNGAAVPTYIGYAIRVADEADHGAEIKDIVVLEFRTDGHCYVRTTVQPVTNPWQAIGTYLNKDTSEFRIQLRVAFVPLEGGSNPGYVQLEELSVTPIICEGPVQAPMSADSAPFAYKGPYAAGVGVRLSASSATFYFDEFEHLQSPPHIIPPEDENESGGSGPPPSTDHNDAGNMGAAFGSKLSQGKGSGGTLGGNPP